ncbi:MAG: hypothetical protein AAFU79_28965 [Myxococcota bacterium]
MSRDPHRTYHANQALELSELTNLQFARTRFGRLEPKYVRMREPDGPSTDDGRRARQPLLLVDDPEDTTGTVFGFVDLFKRTAELRGYDVLNAQHEKRFGAEMSLTRAEYTRLLDELRTFLDAQAFETRIQNTTRDASKLAPSPRPPSFRRIAIVPLVLSGILGFALCYLLVALGLLPVI